MLIPLQIIFWLFASLAVLSALACISLRHPVHSVLSLVVTFFSMAGLWLMLQAEFLSLILLLVYVGAVMTLFLFVVMMLSSHIAHEKKFFVRYLPFGIFGLTVLFIILMMIMNQHFENILPAEKPAFFQNNIAELGMSLFTHYVYSFEIAGILLLAAIVAAISLTHDGKVPRRKSQKINEQLNMSRDQAVRLVVFPKEENK